MSNRPIGVAVIGCGGISQGHLDGWRRLSEAGEASLEVTVDSDLARAQEKAEAYGAKEASTDFEEVMSRPEVEAVDLCLPHHLHLDAILVAAKTGTHVLCEKPLVLNLEEAEKAIRACNEAGVLLMTANRDRFEPHARAVKHIIDQGWIGSVNMILERHMLHKDVITQGNTNNMGWKLGKATSGGGALHRDGCYYIDTLRYFADSEIAKVTGAEFDNFLWNTEEIETTSHVLFRFESGTIGVFEMIWCLQGPHKREVVINGSEGYLELKGAIYNDATITVHSNKLSKKVLGDPAVVRAFEECNGKRPDEMRPDDVGEDLVFRIPYAAGFHAEEKELLRAIREGRQPESSGVDGARALEFIEAAYRSADEGRAVELPLLDWESLNRVKRAS